PGRAIGRVLGNEEDGVVLNPTTPRGLTVLARARLSSPNAVARFADMTIVEARHRGFVFNAGDTSFAWNLGYPRYPGVDPATWMNRPTYPATSQERPAMDRLLGNLIEHATGIRNPVPRERRPASHVSLRILSPVDGAPVPAGRPSVIVWTGTLAGTRQIRIAADGRDIATVPATMSTWT